MEQLSAEAKRRLLAQRLEEKAAQTRHDLPLSYGQEALWFLHQRAPESAAYNTAFTVRVLSRLDVAALQRSLRQLVLRHAVLRTVFPLVNGRPTQAVFGYREASFEQVFVDAFVREEVEGVYRRPFDLENGPLFRTHLFTRRDDDHLLLLCFHHIICDAWAIWVIVNELGQLLGAEPGGQKAQLPATPSYETFVHWQAAKVQEPALWDYWREQLAGEMPVLDLPLDRKRELAANRSGSSHFFTLDETLFSRIRGQAQAMGITPFMFLLAAFQVLLHRYSGQEDVIVGSPTTGRSRADFAAMVGYLVNPIPLRADLSGNPTFADFVQQVRRTVLDGLAHQDYPLPLMVQKLPIKRQAHVSPLFQAFFVYQKPQVNLSETWAGWHIEPYEIAQMEGQFDLHLEVTEQTADLQAILKYNPDLWHKETIERMAGHWQTLLAGALARPDCPIAQLPLLTKLEQQQILGEFNETARDYLGNVCLHQLFEQQVERTPERTAVTFHDQSLTYAQLNQRANQLAHKLRRLGVGADVLVGIAAERSLEMVIGLYAILKAGGAYVPMDPTYPAERLAFMLADAAVPVLLTQRHLLPHLPATEAQIICLDEPLPDEPRHNPTLITTSASLAYMIYTSGSTGQPKGALNAHRGIVNRLLWMQEQFQLAETDRVLQKTPFSFDVSVWEFFWPLLVGARLVIAEPEGHRDGRYLTQTILNEKITTIHFVPSMLALFLQEPEGARCGSLRRVICSGEALPFELQERFFEHLPSVELHNLYGPTEAAIDVTHWRCVPGDARGLVPIGKPIANTQIYIVDKYNQPVPIGVPGELLIGGVQVGQGYWRREELNDLRFAIDDLRLNHHSSIVNRQLYRTGDLCRWLPDGAIEYLGRLDFQVKVRGFRIELGEVEAALVRHTAVSQAVVVAKEDHLVAYAVMDQVQTSEVVETSDVSRLRSHLRQSLPEYMIPSHFVFLAALPLSPNGKVNRRALPEPDRARPETVGFVGVETAVEQQIATVWQTILGVEKVGRYDNFFDLGGHSLLLGQVRSQLEVALARPLPMVVLFQYPTVQSLAHYLSDVAVSITAPPPEERAEDRRSRLVGMRERRRGVR